MAFSFTKTTYQNGVTVIYAENLNDIQDAILYLLEHGGGGSGTDGYSPTVSVEEITSGHRVTITDLNGDHTFDVMDGQGGSGGDSGPNIYGGSNVPLRFVTSDLSGCVEANISDIGATPAVDDYVIGAYSSNIYMFKVAAILGSAVSGYGAIKLTGPTKTSDLTNDSGFVDAPGAASAAPVQSVNGQTGAVTISVPAAATTAPANLGASASVGNGTTWARSNHVHKRPTAAEVGAIPAPSSPTAGQFLVYNGTTWAATTVPNASGVNF